MAEILADNEVRKLIGSVIINGDEKLLNPNGIELRIGKQLFFHSTEEEKELSEGSFLEISPGETVLLSSYEEIDFRRETIQKIYKDCMLMALISPTTTMMREGISNVTTKIDAGFKGVLNWSLRNGSSKKLIIQYKEPVFKLTIFKLSGNENPSEVYGQRVGDTYQNTTGISKSTRTIPSQIPKSQLIKSAFEDIDPKKKLKDADYPFNYIGSEMIDLQNKFDYLSNEIQLVKEDILLVKDDVFRLKEQLDRKTKELTEKIEDVKTYLLEKMDVLFTVKFNKFVGILVSSIIFIYGTVNFLQERLILRQEVISIIMMIAGVTMMLIVFLVLGKKQSH